MILADKIIKERKRLGLSQEELAEKMNVSRQAVSKWEGGQSIPEIEKILQLSSLFGVTTDYLLKDEIEAVQYTPPNITSGTNSTNNTQDESAETEQASVITPEKEDVTSENPSDLADTDDTDNVRKITVKDAEEYISWRRKAAKNIALGVFLCILSAAVISFVGLSVVLRNPENVIYPEPAESTDYAEDLISGENIILVPAPDTTRINVVSSFLLIPLILAVTMSGVVLLAYTGSKNSRWKFIETGDFEIEKAAQETVREHQKHFSGTYIALNVVGAVICVLSEILAFAIVPFLIGSNDVTALLLTIIFAGIGAAIFIMAGVRHASMQKLLKEGKYSVKGKNSNLTLTTSLLYWVMVTTAYILSIILAETSWRESGLWKLPVADVAVYPLVLLICYIFENKHNKV